jgi:hypothetical protein
MSTRTFTLWDDNAHDSAVTMTAKLGGYWNGFPVPVATAQDVVDYWAACRQADPNGEWYAAPFVDDDGNLRIPSYTDPDDRDEDYVYAPESHERVWSPDLKATVCGTCRANPDDVPDDVRHNLGDDLPAAWEDHTPTYYVDGLVWSLTD